MPSKKPTSDPLFPILETRPTGIARLAAEARHTDDGHLIEFRAIQVRSILNKSVSRRRSWTAYTINPYRGCEFGCKYCFARYTHQFLQPESIDSNLHKLPAATTAPLQPQDWATAFEHQIYMKQNAVWLLEQELKRFDPDAHEIVIGAATDPYQPIERRARITRSIFEVFAKRSGYSIGIITKSRLITRDIDVLAEVSRRNSFVVHLTITTPDADLARKIEPRAPRPDLRFAAVRKLRDAGIHVGILCAPLLPGLNDHPKMLDEMGRRAAEARASFFVGHPLFLKLCSRPTYLSFIRENFPHLLADYERRYAHSDFADETYQHQMRTLFDLIRKKYGLRSRMGAENIAQAVRKMPLPQARPQRKLFA